MAKWCKWISALVWEQSARLVLVLTLSMAAATPGTAYAMVHTHQASVVRDEQTILQQARAAFDGPDLTGKDGPLQKIGFDLALLDMEFQAFRASAQQTGATFRTSIPMLSILSGGADTFVTIDAIGDQDVTTLGTDLAALGLQQSETFGNIVSGQMPIAALEQLAALPSLRFARPVIATTQTGTVTGQVDAALGADVGRRQFGVDGQGVTVGVLSDSYNCLGGAPDDVASGDLPDNIVVLAEETGCVRGQDEGRALMQVIADSAPGAQQVFHTAYGGQAAFAKGILKLANVAHAQVIVDDVTYTAEPMFQDGIIAQAVDQVVANGVAYFSSAGNTARQSYESPFVSVLNLSPAVTFSPGILHDFDPGPGVNPFQSVTIPVGTTAVFTLQWDQPYASVTSNAGATSDLDLFLLGASLSPLAFSIDKNTGRDPVEVLKYTNPGPGTNFTLAIAHLLGPQPHLLKYVYTGSGVTINEYATNSSTIYGHPNAAGAIAVGAAPYYATPAFGTFPPQIEAFSAAGSTPILFTRTGAPTIQMRAKPEVVAPDGANTTFFGKDIADPGDGSDQDTLPNFFGTSAAAAHAAALGALVRAANPALSPIQVTEILTGTALNMDLPSFDNNTGYGLVQAVSALTQATRHDLVSTQTSPFRTALPGQPITYQVSFINQGPYLARQVLITNTLPAQVLLLNLTTQTIGDHVTLTALDPAPTTRWLVSPLAIGAGGIMTISGIVDPKLNVDTNLTNHTNILSPGDTLLANNQSEANIAVRVPRVQFARTAANASQRLTVQLDAVNPYADVTINYRMTKNPLAVETSIGAISGTLTIPRGQISTTVTTAVDARGYIQLVQPGGALVGIPSVVALTPGLDSDGDSVLDQDEDINADGDPTNDDTDGDRLPNYLDPDDDGDKLTTRDEDMNDNGSVLDDDTDGDGLPDYLDLVNTNPCIPKANTSACLADPDGDGLPTGQDPAPADPCIPNINALACAIGDADGDDSANGIDMAPGNPCLPNPNAFACPAGDTDSDQFLNNNDPAPLNPCLPQADADACLRDTDGDGLSSADDPAPQDACIPNELALSCLTGDADGDGMLNGSDPAGLDPCQPDSRAKACLVSDPDHDQIDNEHDSAPFDPCLPNPNNDVCRALMVTFEQLYLPLLSK